MEYNFDVRGLKILYPTLQEIQKIIDKVKSDIYTYEQFNTKNSKERVSRKKAFLSVLRGIKKEYEKNSNRVL